MCVYMSDVWPKLFDCFTAVKITCFLNIPLSETHSLALYFQIIAFLPSHIEIIRSPWRSSHLFFISKDWIFQRPNEEQKWEYCQGHNNGLRSKLKWIFHKEDYSLKNIWPKVLPYSEDQINQGSSPQEGNKGRSQVRHEYAWHCFCFILAHALGMDQVSSWTSRNEAFKIKEVFRGKKKQRFSSSLT